MPLRRAAMDEPNPSPNPNPNPNPNPSAHLHGVTGAEVDACRYGDAVTDARGCDEVARIHLDHAHLLNRSGVRLRLRVGSRVRVHLDHAHRCQLQRVSLPLCFATVSEEVPQGGAAAPATAASLLAGVLQQLLVLGRGAHCHGELRLVRVRVKVRVGVRDRVEVRVGVSVGHRELRLAARHDRSRLGHPGHDLITDDRWQVIDPPALKRCYHAGTYYGGTYYTSRL